MYRVTMVFELWSSMIIPVYLLVGHILVLEKLSAFFEICSVSFYLVFLQIRLLIALVYLLCIHSYFLIEVFIVFYCRSFSDQSRLEGVIGHGVMLAGDVSLLLNLVQVI